MDIDIVSNACAMQRRRGRQRRAGSFHGGIGALASWLAIVLALLAGCSRPPAEQRLRETIAGMEAAVEAGDVGDFLDHVSVDFTGNRGQYDRRQLRALLRAVVLRHRDIGVALGPLDITMHGEDRAALKVAAVVTGGSGGLLPDSGRRIDIDSGWREENGEWRCISAEWNE